MYAIKLDNTYEFSMYATTSTLYSTEDLFMAAMIAKEKIEKEIMSFYSSGLVMAVKITKLNDLDICYVIDYENKESGIAAMKENVNGKSCTFKMFYGAQNATILSRKLNEDEEKTFSSISNAVMYMIMFHEKDIINKCKEVFSKVCQIDGLTKAYIKEFQESHAKGE